MTDRPGKLDPLRPRNTYEELLEEVKHWLNRSPEDHDEGLKAVCQLVHDQLKDNPDRDRILAMEVPLSKESEQNWLRLVREGRKRRGRQADPS